MLSADQARRLKAAGLDAYNHNLDTSRRNTPTSSAPAFTRTGCERWRTSAPPDRDVLRRIIGMGESLDDRCELLRTLAAQDPHPESVPINMLVRVRGTPLAEMPPVSTVEMVRMIATARMLMPRAMVRSPPAGSR